MSNNRGHQLTYTPAGAVQRHRPSIYNHQNNKTNLYFVFPKQTMKKQNRFYDALWVLPIICWCKTNEEKNWERAGYIQNKI